MLNIGYYAHSHGSGHCRYADYLNKLHDGRITVFTSREHAFDFTEEVVQLPVEDLPNEEKPYQLNTPAYTHYAPVGVDSVTQRTSMILKEITQRKIDFMIVDLSVEVAALMRVASVPYAYVRLFGNRTDLPHEAAYQGALFLLAYFPAELESPETPEWVVEKTVYLGFKPPVGFNKEAERRKRYDSNPQAITVVRGFGGCNEVDEMIPKVRIAYPNAIITSVGHSESDSISGVDIDLGVVNNMAEVYQNADVIVGACGSNLVSEVLWYGVPFVPVACWRHFDEQQHFCAALITNGLAITSQQFLTKEPLIKSNRQNLKTILKTSYSAFSNLLKQADDWYELYKQISNLDSYEEPEFISHYYLSRKRKAFA